MCYIQGAMYLQRVTLLVIEKLVEIEKLQHREDINHEQAEDTGCQQLVSWSYYSVTERCVGKGVGDIQLNFSKKNQMGAGGYTTFLVVRLRTTTSSSRKLKKAWFRNTAQNDTTE